MRPAKKLRKHDFHFHYVEIWKILWKNGPAEGGRFSLDMSREAVEIRVSLRDAIPATTQEAPAPRKASSDENRNEGGILPDCVTSGKRKLAEGTHGLAHVLNRISSFGASSGIPRASGE